ncbi:AraC family transcriptional regulator [Streptomyces ipomoeae]|uniref:Bacterial transcription activator, effector binding domain protein n=1 Tax=Streptomyces ipomoeae 91-03 TaxID=698759 RepID=L1L8U5_9ACTN|nr:AraC family transcriptional regulator [Streptomyces ipomoeae]EKX69125.1 bacterial transcription activator, effector binding domain protein [Streptomyces ipomoeae 91-03]MDX2692866.1 AraC family transcriptional regulator [Streptomyces ipomoeae]MDX2820214.1 AraC family transcriptional regulator [Streptomyces ipomoeae]MDX2841981.1 AraC family transcriptional regulator [Streptomyces ipomoeae]MDX2874930.1 AraC family transcriptional regulator [Streptomyces ipomoeae]
MLDRLNQVMEHIEGRLDQSIDVAGLARVAATSEYHLRRMFSALAGMPLSEYIRRRRLTVAGAEVLAGHESLLEIAVRYGYGSGEAFARAFRAVHGVGPGEARRTGAVLVSQPRLSFRLTVEGSSSMRYRVVDRPDFSVVGFKARVPLVHLGPNQAIVDLVRGIEPQTLEQLEKLSDQEPQGIVAVCDDLDPSRAEGTELDYYHGVITSPQTGTGPMGTTTLAVPAGTWAVFTTSGPAPQAIQMLWRDVFTEWFPSNPYRSRPGPEILRTRLSPDKTEADAELWLPVEREGREERGETE